MPVIQNDWATIKAKFGDVTALYALTTAQASLLLSIAPQLEWRKTYRAFGYDYADWDYLQAEVADLQRGLTMPVYIDDLVAQLGQMTDAIISLYCCPDGFAIDPTDGDNYTDQYTEEEANGVPPNIVTAGYAADNDDWTGFNSYKCMVSHVAVESLAQKLDQFEELADAASIGMVSVGVVLAIVGTVVGVISGGSFLIILGILGGAAMVAELYQEVTESAEGVFADIAADVRTNAEALACALFAGDGPNDSYDKMITKANELMSSPAVAIIQLMNMRADLKALYSGRYDDQDVATKLADLGYQVVGFDCDTCDEEPPPSGYQLIHPPEVDFSVAMDAGAVDNGSTYDEDTGIVHLDIDNISDQTLNFRAVFDTLGGAWGHKCNHHGFKVKFIGYSLQAGVYNIGEPPSTAHYGDGQVHQPGTTWGGYNVTRHSGSSWDDWVAQYDHVENYSDGQTLSQFNWGTVVTGTPNTFGIYTADYKVWLITTV